MQNTRCVRSNVVPLLGFLVIGLLAPQAAEAGWEYYGEVHAAAGVAGNPRLLDPNAPAPDTGSQLDGGLRLLAGVRAGWDQTTFDLSYAPSGEFYLDSNLTRVSHSLAASWSHDYTSRSSLRLAENLSYTPGQALNPGGIQRTNLPVGSSSTIANDVGLKFDFRKSARTTLSWSVSDARRLFSADSFVDSANENVGFEFRRAVARHNSFVSGYQYGVFSFRDGTGLPGAGGVDPNIIIDPNSPPQFCDPATDPNCPPICRLFPLDPSCLLPLSAAASPPGLAAAAPGSLPPSELGAARHRPYVGYVFDRPRGFHLDLKAGYDLLDFDNPALRPVSSPFVQSAIGWRWARASTLVAYGQGLDEGGGAFTNALTRNARLDVRLKMTDRISLDLGAGGETREGLGEAAGPAASGKLRTSLGTATVDFILSRSWSLAAAYTQYVQRSSGLAVSVADVRTSRVSLGATWGFGRRKATPPDEKL